MTDRPANPPAFTPGQIAEIDQAFADYARRVEHEGERAMRTSLTVSHAGGGQTRFSLAVSLSADPAKLDAGTRRKYERQVQWAAEGERRREAERRRAARVAWWREVLGRPVMVVRRWVRALKKR